jgi:hypothetical protein
MTHPLKPIVLHDSRDSHGSGVHETGLRLERDPVNKRVRDSLTATGLAVVFTVCVLLFVGLAIAIIFLSFPRGDEASGSFETWFFAELDIIPEDVSKRLQREMGFEEFRENSIRLAMDAENRLHPCAGTLGDNYNAYLLFGAIYRSERSFGPSKVEGYDVLLALRLKKSDPTTMIWQRFYSKEMVKGLQCREYDGAIECDIVFHDRRIEPATVVFNQGKWSLAKVTESFDFRYD